MLNKEKNKEELMEKVKEIEDLIGSLDGCQSLSLDNLDDDEYEEIINELLD